MCQETSDTLYCALQFLCLLTSKLRLEEPSSILLTISWVSDSVGFCPALRIAYWRSWDKHSLKLSSYRVKMITLQAIRPFLFQSKSSNAPLKNNFNSSSALINFSVSEPDLVDIVTYVHISYMCGQLWHMPHVGMSGASVRPWLCRCQARPPVSDARGPGYVTGPE